MNSDALNEYSRKNDSQVQTLASKIEGHVNEERIRDADMAEQIIELKAQVSELSGEVRELIGMWQQAKGAVNFMKLMAAIVAGGSAAWAWISAHIAFTPK